jgi:NDP-sugar pyrophosphorylase family protein
VSCGIYLFTPAIFELIAKAIQEKQVQADEMGIDLAQFASNMRLANANAAMSRNERPPVNLEFDVLRYMTNQKMFYAFICDKNQFWMSVKTGSSTIHANRRYLQVYQFQFSTSYKPIPAVCPLLSTVSHQSAAAEEAPN